MLTTTRQWRLNNDTLATVVLPDPRELTPKCIERLRRYVDALEVEAAICWEAVVEHKCTAPPTPAPTPDADHAAADLVRALWLYPGHRLDNRGPTGCIVNTLHRIAPDVAREIRDGADPGEVFRRRWPDPDDSETKGGR